MLRGDAAKNETSFEPEPGGHKYAIELLRQVVNLNHGIFLEDELKSNNGTKFCVGVAGYPEKHFEAPNLEVDMQRLKEKVDAGADYIMTQMFFDNKKYFEFVDKCREMGIHVPIIPGIKPITAKTQTTILPKIFNIDLPEDLTDEVERCKDNAAVKEVGIQWCVQQSKELIKHGVPTLHFYSMGKSDPVYKIAKELF